MDRAVRNVHQPPRVIDVVLDLGYLSCDIATIDLARPKNSR